MNTRLKVETYTVGKRLHYHCIVYPQTKTELGLQENTIYAVLFMQNGQICFQNRLLLESYANNSYHFKLLKNLYIRTGILKVGEWYEMDIHRIAGARE